MEVLLAMLEELGMSASLSFPGQQDILTDPNMWIGDTAATVHMTAHKQGMISKSGEKTNVTTANGTVAESCKVGAIRGVFCDQYCNEYLKSKMMDVAHIKGPYNLYSLSKSMREGWKLEGDSKVMTLTKGDAKIFFDIKVKTP